MSTKTPIRTARYMNIPDVKRMKPTKKHRLAIWECMLGTVYAMNEAGEIQYFDYKWEDAKKFAGVDATRDLRVSKYGKDRCSFSGHELPKKSQTVLWILKA